MTRDDRSEAETPPEAMPTDARAASGPAAHELERLVARLPGIAYRCRLDGGWSTEFASEGALALSGYSAAEVMRERGASYPPLAHPDDVERVRGAVRRAIHAARSYVVTYQIVHADGRVRPVRDTGGGVIGADGRLDAIEGFIEDVSDRAIAEERLARSEAARLESEGLSSIGTWEWDPASDALTWSPELYRIFGLDASSVIATGTRFFDLIHSDDRARSRALVDEALRRETPTSFEYRVVHPDGTTRELLARATPVRGPAGLRLTGIAQDITDRNATVAVLAEREERFRQVANETPAYLWMSSTSEQNTFINRSLAAFLGVDVRSLGTDWLHFVHPDDLDSLTSQFTAADRQREGYAAEVRIRRHDGEWRWMMLRATPRFSESGAFVGFAGSLVDVTEWREAEQRLHFMVEASALLATSLELDALLDAITRIGVPQLGDACLIDVVSGDRHLHRLGAASVSDATRAQLKEFVLRARPGDGDRPLLREALRTGRPVLRAMISDEEIAAVSPGEARLAEIIRNVDLRSLLIVPLLARGEVLGALTFMALGPTHRFGERELELAQALAERAGVAIQNARLYAAARAELAERERAEEARAASEARLQGFFDTPGVLFCIFGITEDDTDYVFLRANPAFAALYGLKAEELSGRTGHDLGIAAERATSFTKVLARCRDTGKTVSLELSPTTVHQPVTILASISRIGDNEDGHAALAFVATDITERKRLEAQFLQAQKMEAVGRLAGGVAHDFNNLLTVIGGSAEFLLAGMSEHHPDREDALEIKRAADRAGALTRQLLAFSRRQVVHPQDVDVNALVRDADKMLRRLIGEDVDLRTTFAGTAPRVHIDPGQLEQALVNLVVNARDAMPAGGRLSISIGRSTREMAERTARPQLATGAYATLAVSDTGTGMDETTRGRMFEPFFTTKEPGKGTGLGLSTVFGIVTQAGGQVLVDSAPGSGTTITLVLPLAGDAARSDAAPEAPRIMIGGTETVLLVEDEPRVRRFTRRALEERGYTVLTAGAGREALAIARAHPGTIHLVLADVVLPELNGREVVEAVEAIRPGIRTLFTSGYAADAMLHHRVSAEGAPFLAKPFTADALALAVRSALDG